KLSVEQIIKILDAEIDINKQMELDAFYAHIHAKDSGDDTEAARQFALQMDYRERIDALCRLRNHIVLAEEAKIGAAV
ncbi:MAG TPA: hypothetical protein O0X27_05630, partial [Methanocorpusculum sp.]|nr:hypothetical protein [Methanocorpusculum sp.]